METEYINKGKMLDIYPLMSYYCIGGKDMHIRLLVLGVVVFITAIVVAVRDHE